MKSATAAGLTTTYTYNALGQRILKSNSLATTSFMYDEAGHLVGEYDGTGQLIEEIVWAGDIPVASVRPGQGGGVGVFYINTDHLNAPTSLSRTNDNVIVWQSRSDPYGAGVVLNDPDGNGSNVTFNRRSPGQYYDVETGLNYNYMRDYDPAVGRYVESDPIGLHGGINTYSYARSNPITHFDPTGLDCQSANGRSVCNYPGGPSFNIPTPPNFPAYLGPNDFLYHSYEVSVSEKCPDNNMMQGLINDPAPGDPMSAASPGGTPNVAQAFGVNNPILSYLTTGLSQR